MIGGWTCPPLGYQHLCVAQRQIEHVADATTREIDAIEEFRELAGQPDSHWGAASVDRASWRQSIRQIRERRALSPICRMSASAERQLT